MRLQVFLAKSGLCSRRQAEKHILKQKVHVNGQLITQQGYIVDPKNDIIEFEKRRCTLKEFVYFLFNKPVKVESTNIKQNNRKTAREYLFPYYKEHLFCVGRLDYMSSGLMIYTNDGDFTYKLSHPRFNVKKTYIITSFQPIVEAMLKSWKKGITIKEISYLLDNYKFISETKVVLSLSEGKNREIRTVFKHYKIGIQTLHRTQIGEFTLKTAANSQQDCDLVFGQVRPISKDIAYKHMAKK